MGLAVIPRFFLVSLYTECMLLLRDVADRHAADACVGLAILSAAAKLLSTGMLLRRHSPGAVRPVPAFRGMYAVSKISPVLMVWFLFAAALLAGMYAVACVLGLLAMAVPAFALYVVVLHHRGRSLL